MNNGVVYLIGAGPGSPGLLTQRACELIRTADIIVYDYLVDVRLLEACRFDCEKIYVGKASGFHSISQEEIERIIIQKASEGKKVVRFKGGDPFIFGRGGEEAEHLRDKGIRFEVVPGITAALAAAAYAGIPLTHRDWSSSVTFLTGHENPEKNQLQVNFRDFAKTSGTLCIYMGIGKLAFIVAELIAGGLAKETPAAIVEWATLPRQRSLLATLETIVERAHVQAFKAPAIIFIGPVVRFKSKINWVENRPLHGKSIVLTRMKEQASHLRKLLETEGAEVIELPLIRIVAEKISPKTNAVFARLAAYDGLVFTSANGVKYFFELFFKTHSDIRQLGPGKIAVIGSATAEALESFHLKAEWMPRHFHAEALADMLIEQMNLKGLEFLVVTGNLNHNFLPQKLSQAGAKVDLLPVYRTELSCLEQNSSASAYREKGANAIVFASSSAVTSFVQQKEHLALSKQAIQPYPVSIGPITSAALRDAGMPPLIEAQQPTTKSIVKALIEKLGQN